MSTNIDFDPPSFAEVIAYLHGVADGIRAGRKGTGSLSPCSTHPASSCSGVTIASAEASAFCDAGEVLRPRRTIPYLPHGVDTAWPDFPSAPLPRARWIDASSVESAAPSARVTHRTIPYLSSAASIEPSASSGFPVDDRTSGVCLRVIPPSAEWFALTGTDDPGYGSQDR
jgi:hypothetical protein